MTAAEREQFLAGVHVGVLSAAVGTAGGTLAVPVWYTYQPGGLLTVLTGRRSRKAAVIRAAGRFGVCAQDDSPPYRYVSVEGPVVSEEDLDPAERLTMARRYLGPAGGDRYVTANPDLGQENMVFRIARNTGLVKIRASDHPRGSAVHWPGHLGTHGREDEGQPAGPGGGIAGHRTAGMVAVESGALPSPPANPEAKLPLTVLPFMVSTPLPG